MWVSCCTSNAQCLPGVLLDWHVGHLALSDICRRGAARDRHGCPFELGKLSAAAWLGQRHGGAMLRAALVALLVVSAEFNSVLRPFWRKRTSLTP